MHEKLILKDTELKILLSACGVKYLFGYEQAEKRGENNIPYIIHGLVRKGVLLQDMEVLKISEPYLKVVEVMKRAKMVLAVRYGSARDNTVYLYIGQGIVMMTDSLNDKNAIKLQLLETSVFKDNLLELFHSERQVSCPEELNLYSLSEEKGVCKIEARLYSLVGQCWGELLYEWFLFEGKYCDYVQVNKGDGIEYKEYSTWDKTEIFRVIDEAKEEDG